MVTLPVAIGFLAQLSVASAASRHHALHRRYSASSHNNSFVDRSNFDSQGFQANPLGRAGPNIANDPFTTPLVDNCPKSCQEAGPDPALWTHIHDPTLLAQCEHDLLFDMNVHTSIADRATIRVCSLEGSVVSSKTKRARSERRRHNENVQYGAIPNYNGSSKPSESCGASKFVVPVKLTAGPSLLSSGDDAATASSNIAVYMIENPSCGVRIMFSKSGSAYVGMYIGADVLTDDAGHLFDEYSAQFKSGIQSMQSCNTAQQYSRTTGVIAVHGVHKLDAARKTVQVWARGSCLDHAGAVLVEETVPLTFLASSAPDNGTEILVIASGNETLALRRRGECRAIPVEKDDGCASLASKCNIRGAQFVKFNPKPNLCSTLQPKQLVCCSEGTLPETTLQPQPDGTCRTHAVKEKDDCWGIEDSYGMQTGEIAKLNKNTWGWSGCGRMQLGQIICISKGNTPMPAQLPDIACGPQKIGTQPPSGEFTGWDLAKLNPCPLNACCSGWGYCGISEEFCIESPSDTGAPGSFEYKKNGCISNCGMDIVGNDMTPGGFANLGYFQGYNPSRSCLHMDALELSKNKGLTHVHFAFAVLTDNFQVKIPDDTKDQFDVFVGTPMPFKKILSFGGWAASTEPGSYQIFRNAVKPENRGTTARNVVNFLNKYDLHGVDFDWEYPGAWDIPGVPGGDANEGENYLEFLKIMKDQLVGENHRTLSIALPSSYWYLRGFPVKEMAKVVSYMVLMTYDLHGQWDYDNKFTNPGCPTGNCLRSHVNRTETYSSLALVTKAGVPPSKLFVGISSYGRSFRMKDSKCTSPECLFTGSFFVSDAEPGICTGTSGYISNAEILTIWDTRHSGSNGLQAKWWYDEPSDSDIMIWYVEPLPYLTKALTKLYVYIMKNFAFRGDGMTHIERSLILCTDGTQNEGITDWVAYMTDTTKARRREWIKGLNFGGTTDWALDLAEYYDGPVIEGGWDVETDTAQCDQSSWPTTLDGFDKDIGSVPMHCRGMALTRYFTVAIEEAMTKFYEVSTGYDDKFGWYADWVKDAIDDRLDEFLAIGRGKGLPYMDCKWETRKNKGSGPCTEATLEYDLGMRPGPRIVEFTMRDEEGFYSALGEHTGINKTWITFRDHAIVDPCRECGPLPTCPEAAFCGSNYYMRKNFPRRINDKSKIEIENPKKVITEAMPRIRDMANVGVDQYMQMRWGFPDADSTDVLDSFALPLFMLEDSFDSIKQIKEIGEQQKKTKTRELVIMILTIIFSVIPFAGQATSLLGGAARIAQTALIVGEIGNAALAIEEIINDPSSAPFAVLTMLVGASGTGGVRAKGPRKGFKQAADAKRALDSKSLKLFTPEFQRKNEIVGRLTKQCML